MKKIDSKERIAPKVTACFEDEPADKSAAMISLTTHTLSQTKENTGFKIDYKILINIFRQVFLFFPGAFALYFTVVSLTGFFYFEPHVIGGSPVPLSLTICFFSAVLTFLGLGNIKNPKHLVIPFTIVSFSIIVGLIGCYRYNSATFPYFLGKYVPLFLPFALMTPFLAKLLVDSIGKKE